MDGTAIKSDSGNFSLTGLKAGVVYGTMGNTGISGRPHVDFNISNSTNRSLSFSDLFKEKLYPYKQTPYAKNFSGLASRIWYENSTVKSYMLDFEGEYKKVKHRGRDKICAQSILSKEAWESI